MRIIYFFEIENNSQNVGCDSAKEYNRGGNSNFFSIKDGLGFLTFLCLSCAYIPS